MESIVKAQRGSLRKKLNKYWSNNQNKIRHNNNSNKERGGSSKSRAKRKARRGPRRQLNQLRRKRLKKQASIKKWRRLRDIQRSRFEKRNSNPTKLLGGKQKANLKGIAKRRKSNRLRKHQEWPSRRRRGARRTDVCIILIGASTILY